MSSSEDLADKIYGHLTGLLQDLTSLTVETYTVKPDGGSTLQAKTHLALDGDTTEYLPVGPDGKIVEAVLKQHHKTLAQARGERKLLVETLMRVVEGRLAIEKAEAEK